MKKLFLVILFFVTFDCVLAQETFLPFKLGDSKEFVLRQIKEKLKSKHAFGDTNETTYKNGYIFKHKIDFIGVRFTNNKLYFISLMAYPFKTYIDSHEKILTLLKKEHGISTNHSYKWDSLSDSWDSGDKSINFICSEKYISLVMSKKH